MTKLNVRYEYTIIGENIPTLLKKDPPFTIVARPKMNKLATPEPERCGLTFLILGRGAVFSWNEGIRNNLPQ
jgi:hypothetical protein